MEEERLKVLCSLASGVAVTDMTDRHLTGKLSDSPLVNHLTYKAFTLYSMEGSLCVNGHDTTTLLTSVLKGVQAIISKACSILNTVDSKHATLMVELVIPVFVTITHFAVRFTIRL